MSHNKYGKRNVLVQGHSVNTTVCWFNSHSRRMDYFTSQYLGIGGVELTQLAIPGMKAE